MKPHSAGSSRAAGGSGRRSSSSPIRRSRGDGTGSPGDRSTLAADVQLILQELGPRLTALSGTTILVTGAGGFLCSYFVDTVAGLNDSGLDPPCRVLAVDNMRTGTPARLAHLRNRKDVQLLRGDITRPLGLRRRVDWIIHGASIASPTFYRRFPLETIDTNVTGTRQMLDLARRGPARAMVYLSTSEIYGDPDPAFIPTREDYRGYVSSTGPRACYDESKRLAETLCVTYERLHAVPVKIVRPFNVYGPGQRLDDARIIPDLMKAALHHEPIVLFSDGRASRTLCYVTDAVRAIWYILLSEGPDRIFNVGSDEREISVQDLAETMREVAGPPPLRIEHRASTDGDYVMDNPQRRRPDLTRLRSAFPWQPRVTLREGLERTLRSYQEALATEGR